MDGGKLTTAQDRSHSAYLSALREIDSIPVPDLASTLTPNPPIVEPNPARLAFFQQALIDHLEAQGFRDGRLTARGAAILEELAAAGGWGAGAEGGSGGGGGRQERVDRVLARLNSLHEAAAQDAAAATEAIAGRTTAGPRGATPLRLQRNRRSQRL